MNNNEKKEKETGETLKSEEKLNEVVDNDIKEFIEKN